MLRRDFHFAGHAVRVEADEEPLLWLHEFVAPQFAIRDIDEPDQIIRLVIDAREHARLAAGGPHPADLTRPCFTLDSGIVVARVWQAPGQAEVVFEEARDVFYRRESDEPTVVEVVAAGDTDAARVALMRVLREYATLYAARAGWLMVHAAAVCVGDEAFVIAGPKRAGKTTLLLHALRHEKGAYLSNDRVALRSEPSGVTVHGIPTIVSIRKESTAWFGDLDAKLAGVRYNARLAIAERDVQRRAAPPIPTTTWSLSPRQLCHLLGAESRATARVAGLLFPVVDATVRGTRFERLEGQQALDALHGALFRACPENGMFRIGEDIEADSGGGLVDLPAQVLSRVPSTVCRLGPDAYGDGVQWLCTLRPECPPVRSRASGHGQAPGQT